MSRTRDMVLASLAAIGARSEAAFYAESFSKLEPERFAFLVVDPRAVQGSLLEAFVSNVRLLADLELTPIIVIGVLDEEAHHVRFQSQKLSKELSDAGVQAVKLNTATYGLLNEIRKTCREARIPILEVTDTRNRLDLGDLIAELHPDKVIFLQPSGGLSRGGRRIAVINIDSAQTEDFTLSIGQSQFVDYAKQLLRDIDTQTHYVIASPLNLLAELFTETGSGTLVRRGATIKELKTLRALDTDVLVHSIEEAFGRRLDPEFPKQKFERVFVEADYRAGAIIRDIGGERGELPYMSKFWVSRAARGEGLGRDIWNAVLDAFPTLVWRSREANVFNGWYTRRCDGMQRGKSKDGRWDVFWVGLTPSSVPRAISAARDVPDDFIASSPPIARDEPSMGKKAEEPEAPTDISMGMQ